MVPAYAFGSVEAEVVVGASGVIDASVEASLICLTRLQVVLTSGLLHGLSSRSWFHLCLVLSFGAAVRSYVVGSKDAGGSRCWFEAVVGVELKQTDRLLG